MKSNKILLVGASLSIFGLACEKKVKLETDEQKSSYAVGHMVGQDLKMRQMDVDAEGVAAGIQDVIKGKESRLKPDELRAALQKLSEGSRKKMADMQAKAEADAGPNLEASKKFMEKVKTQPNVKETPSGLLYSIESEGEGEAPKLTDVVKATYKGTLSDGTEFDASGAEPVEFPLGQVIKGWQEGLQLIKPKGKIKLYIPPDLGYGARPLPKIPSNSALVFEVELKEVIKKDQAMAGAIEAATKAAKAETAGKKAKTK